MYEEYTYTLEDCQNSVGTGWDTLIKRCYEACQSTDPPIYITQVKEKFGGLRFYIGGAPEEVHDIISECEDASYRICEVCGDEGKLVDTGGRWVKTLCEKCFADLKTHRPSRFK